jgi:hypothetical protein
MAERVLSQKQIASILTLEGPGRNDHFVKHVVDCEQAWGLYSEGWAMGSDDDGNPTFQLWPAKEYAVLCASGLWEGYEPAEIPLEDLVEELLPKLQRDNVALGIFRTPEGQSVMPTIDQLTADLKTEMERYG